MKIERCLCGQNLYMPISTKKWNCVKCGRQWELAEIIDILDYENAPDSHLERFYKDCEEELNVLYVALTRSNNCLYLNKDLTEYCKRKGIL